MTGCDAMRERMPEVVHGRAEWAGSEAAHLASCADCELEWRIVRAGADLAADTAIRAEPLAELVAQRLRESGSSGSVISRLPWRGGLIGLLAAAASVVLFVGIARHDRRRLPAAGDSVAAVILPELQGLDAGQLESVLRSMGPTAGDATPGVLPHLEDLTDSELEQLLHSEGGQ